MFSLPLPTEDDVLKAVISLPLTRINGHTAVRHAKLLQVMGAKAHPQLIAPIEAHLSNLEKLGKLKLLRMDGFDENLIYGIQVVDD